MASCLVKTKQVLNVFIVFWHFIAVGIVSHSNIRENQQHDIYEVIDFWVWGLEQMVFVYDRLVDISDEPAMTLFDCLFHCRMERFELKISSQHGHWL